MNVQQFVLNVNSEDPDGLVRFYQDIVGLEARSDLSPGALAAGTAILIVEGHSDVKGAAKEPQRLLLDFVVDDAIAEQRRLKSAGVRFVRDAYEEPGVGVFATFADPDGNLCQLVELRL